MARIDPEMFQSRVNQMQSNVGGRAARRYREGRGLQGHLVCRELGHAHQD
ncbi:MAG TPA: hypothetical protein VF767_10870 [Bryobacteraceae bacterium]